MSKIVLLPYSDTYFDDSCKYSVINEGCSDAIMSSVLYHATFICVYKCI
jgi:hypothetical protein